MKSQHFLVFGFVILICLSISCERIPQPDPALANNLVETELIGQEGIPLDYGKLVSVTSAKPGIAHMWFEDENHTIRMIQINYGEGNVNKKIKIIKRK